MANEIRLKPIAKATFSMTVASLAASSGRQSTMLNNSSNYPGALVYIILKSGTAPTADGTYDVYLLRGNDAASSDYRSDGAGASDAAWSPVNARLLGQIVVTNSANTPFYGSFDTAELGPLGAEWGIGIRNSSDQALNASGHYVGYRYYVPEIQ